MLSSSPPPPPPPPATCTGLSALTAAAGLARPRSRRCFLSRALSRSSRASASADVSIASSATLDFRNATGPPWFGTGDGAGLIDPPAAAEATSEDGRERCGFDVRDVTDPSSSESNRAAGMPPLVGLGEL